MTYNIKVIKKYEWVKFDRCCNHALKLSQKKSKTNVRCFFFLWINSKRVILPFRYHHELQNLKVIKNCINGLSSIYVVIVHGLIQPRENGVQEKSKTNVRVLVETKNVPIVSFQSMCLVVEQKPTRHEPTIKIIIRTKALRLFFSSSFFFLHMIS